MHSNVKLCLFNLNKEIKMLVSVKFKTGEMLVYVKFKTAKKLVSVKFKMENGCGFTGFCEGSGTL